MELAVHLALFVLLSVCIVVMSAFYAEAEDKKALATVPHRLLVFFVSCALLAAVMLFCEHTFASVS
jgi:hypothetical protein